MGKFNISQLMDFSLSKNDQEKMKKKNPSILSSIKVKTGGELFNINKTLIYVNNGRSFELLDADVSRTNPATLQINKSIRLT